MFAIFWLVGVVLNLLMWAFIIRSVMSWLISFGVINPRNQAVYTISNFLYRLTEPMLSPIRRVLPDLGAIDISPVIAILILAALKLVAADIYVHLVAAGLAF